MCQPAPLARCSNHASKEAKQTADDLITNYEKRLEISEKIVEMKSQARDAGIDDKAIMDPNNSDLKELNNLREKYEGLEKEQSELVRDTWEHELHLDATPAGLKSLEKEKDKVGNGGFRLKNATALKEWQKGIRDLKDSEGNKLTEKGGSPDDRHKVYLQEFITARSEHKNAQDSAKEAARRLEHLNEKLDGFKTTNIGFKNVGDRRAGSRVAVNPNDAAEVDYLERQKTSVMTMETQAHYDQVLARAKMNRLRKAIQNNRKAQNKAAIVKQDKEVAAAKYAENKLIANGHSEDLKRASITLANEAKKSRAGSNDESIRLSAKADAVRFGSDLYEKYRSSSHGNEANAAKEFRADITARHSLAVQNVKTAKKEGNKIDEAIYTGEQGGLSLLLDKVRELK